MVNLFLPGSFTKQFSWGKDPKRLHRSIRNGFAKKAEPVPRDKWRRQCGLNDPNIELIPLNFFLYSIRGEFEDFVISDTLVEFALNRPFDPEFAKLAVFAFHLANSGNWHGSEPWPDGAVAGWANHLIRKLAWNGNDWEVSAFEKQTLLIFVRAHLIAESGTQRKIRNNYHFMLRKAGVLVKADLAPMNYAAPWAIAAPKLFWDRKIFDGALTPSSTQNDFESLFIDEEVYKLIRSSEVQGRALAKTAFRDYSTRQMRLRFEQFDQLRPKLSEAA